MTSRPRSPGQQRLVSPRSPLEGRQLWRIGDWGGASEAIGRRWEEVGARVLDDLLGKPRPGPNGREYLPRAAVVLTSDPALAAAVQRHGRTHADALLVGVERGRPVLEPVDFKWSLETADVRQVSRSVLEALLADPPEPLRQALARALERAGVPPDAEPLHYDGIFLAPDHAANRVQLAPRGPLDPVWVALAPVDPQAFFAPLPGWDVAQALARADGVRLDRLETAERYYRLGAGTLGALRKLRGGIFADEPPPIDGPAATEQLRRERRLRTLGDLIAYLDRALAARSALLERLRAIERAALPYGRFRAALAERGLGDDPRERRRWDRVHGEILATVGRALRREGRALVARGRSELEALAELEALLPRWERYAQRLLSERLAAPPTA